MSNYILDKAYTIATSGGVETGRVVVVGSAAGECILPAAANAGKVLGVTMFSQPNQGRNVTVRKAGIARCVAAGAINIGDPVNVAGTSGKVKAVDETTGTHVNCIGFTETAATAEDDLIDVFLSFHERIVP